MWIEREIAAELKKAAATFPVVALVGPRQVGKTSILERMFPDYNYVSLDVAANAEAAETRPKEFLQKHKPPVVVDEVQYAPTFFRHIKTHVDAHKGCPCNYAFFCFQFMVWFEACQENLELTLRERCIISLAEVSKAGRYLKMILTEKVFWEGLAPFCWRSLRLVKHGLLFQNTSTC
jgi:hypothetical protein